MWARRGVQRCWRPHWKRRIQHSLALLLILLFLAISQRKDAIRSSTFWTVSTRRSALLASNACELSARLQQEMQHARAQQPPADVEAANLAPCVAAALLPWLATLDLPQWLTPAAELATELGEATEDALLSQVWVCFATTLRMVSCRQRLSALLRVHGLPLQLAASSLQIPWRQHFATYLSTTQVCMLTKRLAEAPTVTETLRDILVLDIAEGSMKEVRQYFLTSISLSSAPLLATERLALCAWCSCSMP
jgi:hypothetical protein